MLHFLYLVGIQEEKAQEIIICLYNIGSWKYRLYRFLLGERGQPSENIIEGKPYVGHLLKIKYT